MYKVPVESQWTPCGLHGLPLFERGKFYIITVDSYMSATGPVTLHVMTHSHYSTYNMIYILFYILDFIYIFYLILYILFYFCNVTWLICHMLLPAHQHPLQPWQQQPQQQQQQPRQWPQPLQGSPGITIMDRHDRDSRRWRWMTRTAPNDARCVVWAICTFFFFSILTSIFSYYFCLGRMEERQWRRKWAQMMQDMSFGPLVSVVFFLSGFFQY